ncbi:LARGE xylosyl- and glucuronyltransferase 2 [Hondaea fermentalgiana]|uniref:LARGE xylosyl-and glucuronyltransferase 2 n=1 Tax=Hondaea fermentalgiana TaxID=2315210 RepID=A0A2R5H1T8_9STRA|nr:LARGE xylosyl- and glucuronyltransferase 2 [Hondaea fermentalgiana]|eukprot:GBG34324.1 LARGE xylosyl- and glucuronyltransferase 2 [Hondaea fermentalgiana]
MGTGASSQRKALAKGALPAEQERKVQDLLVARRERDTDVLFLAVGYASTSSEQTKLNKGKSVVVVNCYRVYLFRGSWTTKFKVTWSVPVVHIAKIAILGDSDGDGAKGSKKVDAFRVRLTLINGSSQDLLVSDPESFARSVQTAHAMASYGVPWAFVMPPQLESPRPIIPGANPVIDVPPFLALFRIYANIISGSGVLAQQVLDAGATPITTPDDGLGPISMRLSPTERLGGDTAWQPAAAVVIQALTALTLAATYDASVKKVSLNGLDDALLKQNPDFRLAIWELLRWNVGIEALELCQIECEPAFWSVLSQALLANPRPSMGVHFMLDRCNVDSGSGLALAMQRAYYFASPLSLRVHQFLKAGQENVDPNAEGASWIFEVFNGDYLPSLDATRPLPLPYLGMLQELDLTGTVIPVASFEAANASLSGCASLRKLVLAGSLQELASQGLVEDLLKALPASPLATLDLSDNSNLFAVPGSRFVDALADFVYNRLGSLVSIVLTSTNISGNELLALCKVLCDDDQDALALRRKKFAATRRLVPAVQWTRELIAQAAITLCVGSNESLTNILEAESMPKLPIGFSLVANNLTWSRLAQKSILQSLHTTESATLDFSLDEANAQFDLHVVATDYPHLQAFPHMDPLLYRGGVYAAQATGQPSAGLPGGMTIFALASNIVDRIPYSIIQQIDVWSRTDIETQVFDSEPERELCQLVGDTALSCEDLWKLSLRNWRLGPMASAFFEEGVALNKTLLSLDITGNYIGDRGAEALGRALRTNRTLVSLHMDDNHVGLDGWKAIRGALYGNRKIAEFTYPAKDVARRNARLNQQIALGDEIYKVGKLDIKRTYNSYSLKPRSVEVIKYGKKLRRHALAHAQKIQDTLSQILAAVADNANGWGDKFAPKQDKQRAKAQDRIVSKVARKQAKLLAKMTRLLSKSAAKGRRNKRGNPYVPSAIDPLRRGPVLSTDPVYDYDDYLGETYPNDVNRLLPYRYRGRRRRYIDRASAHHDGHVNGGNDGRDSDSDSSDDHDDHVDHVNDNDREMEGGRSTSEQQDSGRDREFATAETAAAAILALGAAAFLAANLDQLQAQAAMLDPSVQAQMNELIDEGRETTELLNENTAMWGPGAAEATAGALDDAVDSPDLSGLDLDGDAGADNDDDNDDDDDMDDVEMYAGAGPDQRDGDFRAPPRAPRVLSGSQGPILHAAARGTVEYAVQGSDCSADRDLERLRVEFTDWFAEQERLFAQVDADLKQASARAKVEAILNRGQFWKTPSSYSSQILWTLSSEQKQTDQRDWCVLCTQLSADRWPRFERLARSWNGALSAAVYLPNDDETAIPVAARLRASCEALVKAQPRLRLHVVLVTPSTLQTWYPINMLRNAALVGARSAFAPVATHVFLLDVDFMVDHMLADRLRDDEDLRTHVREARDTAFVVPAFENVQEELRKGPFACLDTRDVRASFATGRTTGFHVENFPKGHGPTNFARWADAQEHHLRMSYAVSYEDCFEPYVIVRVEDVPLYDERFTGYGMNKISHLFSLSRRVSKFRVLFDHCVVADPHPRSDEWARTSSTRDRLAYLKALYISFKRSGGRKIVVSATTTTATARLDAEQRKKTCAPEDYLENLLRTGHEASDMQSTNDAPSWVAMDLK